MLPKSYIATIVSLCNKPSHLQQHQTIYLKQAETISI